MNIHIFINCYWGTGISGGDRRILELLKRWHNTDQYKFIVYTTHSFYKVMKAEGITHLSVEFSDEKLSKRHNIIFEYICRTLICIRKLKKNISKGDVLYSPTDILPDVIPAFYVKAKYRKKVRWCMISFHVFETFYKRPGNVMTNFISCFQQKYAMHLGNKYSNAYLTTSPVVYDYMKQHKYSMDKVHLINNAVDVLAIERSNLRIKGYDACFLARLNYSKGIFELPEIWKKVTEKFPDAKLGIIGKGSEEITIQMRKCILEYGMQNNIEMLGYVETDKAYSIMKNSKVFLFTSHEEGWGMALAEALVCGIPAVVYDLAIFRHLFKEGVTLCKLKDTQEMALQVCYMLENEKERRREGEKGRKYVLEHYSLDSVASEELKILMNNVK